MSFISEYIYQEMMESCSHWAGSGPGSSLRPFRVLLFWNEKNAGSWFQKSFKVWIWFYFFATVETETPLNRSVKETEELHPKNSDGPNRSLNKSNGDAKTRLRHETGPTGPCAEWKLLFWRTNPLWTWALVQTASERLRRSDRAAL